MNSTNGSQSFSVTLTNEQLRRDAQAAIAQFNRIGQGATQAGATIDRGMNSMSKNITNAIRTMTSGITSAMNDMAQNVVGITALLSSGTFLKSLYDESKAFNREMKIVSTISEEVAADMEGYKQQVLDLCTQISVAPDTAAQALYQINSAGHLGADGMKVLEASAKAAVGGVTDTAVAADAITTILNAYKFSADDAEMISDKLFTTVRLGKTTMDELGRSIAYVAPLAATYKISIDEVLAGVANLTKQGNSTQSAMTQISAAITAIVNELGDTAFENGLLGAFEEIEKRSNGSNLALKQQLSNIRAVRAALGLAKDNAAETADMLDQIRNSAGATEAAVKKMNTGASAELRMLRTNFLKELKSFGDGMSNTLAGLAHLLNQAFASGDMQKMLGVLKDLIITYGIYKTLIITMTALNKVYKNVMSQVAYQKTLAIMQQKSLNTQQALGAVITTNLKRAFQSLTLALKANAFGIAVGAITAAAYAIYKFCTRVSEAERAHKRLSVAMNDAQREAGDEKRQIEKLLTTLKSAKKDSQEYKDAKQKIIDQYGQYLQGLINERGEITNLAEAYRRLAEQASKAAKQRALASVNEEAATDLQKSNKKATEQMLEFLKGQNIDDETAKTIVQRLQYSLETTGEIPADIIAKYGTQKSYSVDGFKRADKDEQLRFMFTSYAKSMQEGYKTYKKALEDNERYIGNNMYDPLFKDMTSENLDADLTFLENTLLNDFKEGKRPNGTVLTFSGGQNRTIKNEEELRLLIEQMKAEQRDRQIAVQLGAVGEGSGGENTKSIEEQMLELISQAKTETDAGKLSQLKDKIDDMLKKEGVDTTSQQYKDLQAAAKTVKKKLGQGGNDSGKTQAELDAEVVAARQKWQNLELAQNRERAKTLAQDEIDLQRMLAEAQLEGAEKRKRLRELDIEQEKLDYQNQMRDAIQAVIDGEEAKFNAAEEVAEKDAAAKGNTHYAKKTFSTANLSPGELSVGDKIEDMSVTNVGNLSVEAVQRINDLMALYKTLSDGREQIMRRELDDDAAQAFDEYLRDYGTYLQKRQALIDIANRKMANAETEGVRLSIAGQLEKDLSELDQKANKKTSAVAQLFSDMTDKTIADMRRIETQGRKALDFLTKGEWNADTGAELGMSEETFNTLLKSPEELEKIRKAIAAIKKEADGCENGFKKFADGLKDIFKAGNNTKDFQKALGKISEGMQTVSQVAGFLQGSLGQLGETFGSDTLGDIANGIGTAMDAMDSAMQGAQAGAAFGPWGAAAGAAIGLVSSLGSAIAKLHDAKHEKKIEELQEQVEVLEKSYDQLGRAVDKAYSGKAKELIEQQNVLLRQKQILIKQQIAEEEAKKNTDKDKIKDWKNQLQEIENQIQDNKEAAIDAIYGEEVSSAIDRFTDAYASMFDGGTTRARASKDVVKQMIKNMITEAMKADVSAPMEKLRQMLMGFWNDEVISEWEEQQAANFVESVMAEQEKKWGWADSYFKDSTSQNSSKGGFTTMSQDSADELNGRFTALQMAGEQVKLNTADINEQLKVIAARNAITASTVDEIRGLTLLAVDHLDSIRKHTANLKEMNDRLGKIEKYTSRL